MVSIYIVAPVIGFVGMLSGGYWGVGCGWIVVPTMIIAGVDTMSAIGIGLLQMIPSTITTVVKHTPQIGWKKGGLGLAVALPICIAAGLASLLGKAINGQIIEFFGGSRVPIQIFLLCLITIIALQVLFSRTPAYGDDIPVVTGVKSFIAGSVGFVTGILSSMAGIGGGLLIRPLLTSGLKIPEFFTVKIVRLVVLVTTCCGGMTYLFANGGIDGQVLLLSGMTAAGGMIGFPIGARMHKVVYDAGYAQHIHKSFAFIAIAVLSTTILKMCGYGRISEVLLLMFAFGLAAYLFWFEQYTRKHPLRTEDKEPSCPVGKEEKAVCEAAD